MKRVIKVKLPMGWSDRTLEYPRGLVTFLRDVSKNPGVIQVSLALYESGKIPNPSHEDLIELAKNVGENMPAGDLIETSSGSCAFGIFGTAIFESEKLPRTQVWYLSDGCSFILATHIFTEPPEYEEIDEAQGIIRSLYAAKVT